MKYAANDNVEFVCRKVTKFWDVLYLVGMWERCFSEWKDGDGYQTVQMPRLRLIKDQVGMDRTDFITPYQKQSTKQHELCRKTSIYVFRW